MAVGKNKRLSKGKKGLKKKIIDPFARKEWYDIKAPAIFNKTNVGKTLCNRTQGLKIASEALKGRIFDVSQADLNNDADDVVYRKFLLKCEEVQGRNLLTNFHGMRVMSDRIRSLVKKWHTTIEARHEAKTLDGYTVRVFVIGFTKRADGQKKKTTYAQSSQVHKLRKNMFEIINREVTGVDLRGLFKKLVAESIGKDIEKASVRYYPLENVLVRKVKIIKAPKVDLGKLLELHDSSSEPKESAKITRTWKEPAVLTQL